MIRGVLSLLLFALGGCASISSLAAARDLHGLCVFTADSQQLEREDSSLVAQTLHESGGVEVSARLLTRDEAEALLGVPLDGDLIEIRTRLPDEAAFQSVAARPLMVMDGGSVERFPEGRYAMLQLLPAAESTPEALPERVTAAPYAPTARPELHYRPGREPTGAEQGVHSVVRIFSLGVLNPRPPPATLTPASRRAVTRWRAENEPLREAWDTEQAALVEANEAARVAAQERNAEGVRQATERDAGRERAVVRLSQSHCDTIQAGSECAEIFAIPSALANAAGRLSVSVSGPLHGSPSCVAAFSLGSSPDATLRQSLGTPFEPTHARPGDVD